MWRARALLPWSRSPAPRPARRASRWAAISGTEPCIWSPVALTLSPEAARRLVGWLTAADPGHPRERVRFTTSWTSRPPLNVVLVEPALAAEIDEDTGQDRRPGGTRCGLSASMRTWRHKTWLPLARAPCQPPDDRTPVCSVHLEAASGRRQRSWLDLPSPRCLHGLTAAGTLLRVFAAAARRNPVTAGQCRILSAVIGGGLALLCVRHLP